MIVTRIRLKNWRNFRNLDVSLCDINYLLGANATGKSNFLDVFRFLRDICQESGGGFQDAIRNRGGLKMIRCLHARNPPEVEIYVELSDSKESNVNWRYLLAFRSEKSGKHRPFVYKEEIWKNDEPLLQRPTADDMEDSSLLTQTHLEQIQANAAFRELVDFFGKVSYLHLVPQLLKFGEAIGGKHLQNDPFGQEFLERIAKTPNRTRKSRLDRISRVLEAVIPHFAELSFEKDEYGHPHLSARYEHHRPKAGWQREESFSDGTLRLIGLFWAILEKNVLLLLEEPEISLNEEIVSKIPGILDRLLRSKKTRQQIILSTHSKAMLSNRDIDCRGVIILESTENGSEARSMSEKEKRCIESGLSIAEVMSSVTRPKKLEQLGLF